MIRLQRDEHAYSRQIHSDRGQRDIQGERQIESVRERQRDTHRETQRERERVRERLFPCC